MDDHCPRCGSAAQASIWPFLKGVDASGVELQWMRCVHCHALYSDLTVPKAPRYGEAYVETGQHTERDTSG